MQAVSDMYRESMKSPLRERAYILITAGIINQDALKYAKFITDSNKYTSFSNSNILKASSTDTTGTYATFEENFTKLDGSMRFLPKSKPLDKCLIGQCLITDEASYIIDIPFLNSNGVSQSLSIKGLTIYFGDNYPIDFDIIGDNTDLEFRDNTDDNFIITNVINNTTHIKFIFYKLKNNNSRLRIYSLLFGLGLTFTNKDVVESSYSEQLSPIAENLPQYDFSVTVKNYDEYFNLDNPDSILNYFETGQELNVSYGYQLPDSEEIEWIKGGKFYISEWSANTKTASISGVDVLRNLTEIYYYGTMQDIGTGLPYNWIAEKIFELAGITDYYIDTSKTTKMCTVPFPRVSLKEALQLLANACECVLRVDRNGTIRIEDNQLPVAVDVTQKSSQEWYSNSSNIVKDTTKAEYGTLANNNTTVDGKMFFMPQSETGVLSNTGCVFKWLSNADGYFSNSPDVEVSLSKAYEVNGIVIKFGGNCLPTSFMVGGQWITDGIQKNMIIKKNFGTLNRILFYNYMKSQQPYQRMSINYIGITGVSNFTMEKSDITSDIESNKLELVKDITIKYTDYIRTMEKTVIYEADVSGTTLQLYFDKPYRHIQGTLDGVSISFTEHSDWFIKYYQEDSFNGHLILTGYPYQIIEDSYCLKLNEKGKSIIWENPAIGDKDVAYDVAHWLADYYSCKSDYEYDTRGNPELEANDLISQENPFVIQNNILLESVELNYNGTFSGHVQGKRWEV